MNFCYTGRADTSAPAQGKIIEGAEPMATMNSLTDICSVVMDSLSQELTQTAINTWFSDCTPIEINKIRSSCTPRRIFSAASFSRA